MQQRSTTPLSHGSRPRRVTRGYGSRPPVVVPPPVIPRLARRGRKVCREMRQIDGVVLEELRLHYDPKLRDRGRRDALRAARKLWKRLIDGGHFRS